MAQSQNITFRANPRERALLELVCERLEREASDVLRRLIKAEAHRVDPDTAARILDGSFFSSDSEVKLHIPSEAVYAASTVKVASHDEAAAEV